MGTKNFGFTKMDGWLVKALLKKLPGNQRKAVILRFWHNSTIEEISSTLRLSWSETNSLLDNALLKLREGLLQDPLFFDNFLRLYLSRHEAQAS